MTYDFATPFHCLNVLEPTTASYLRMSIDFSHGSEKRFERSKTRRSASGKRRD